MQKYCMETRELEMKLHTFTRKKHTHATLYWTEAIQMKIFLLEIYLYA